jgi:hypothetical protein
MRVIKINVTDKNGVLLDSTAIEVGSEITHIEFVPVNSKECFAVPTGLAIGVEQNSESVI